MALETLHSKCTKIMEGDRLSIWATSISDRNVLRKWRLVSLGIQLIIICLVLLMTFLLLPFLIFIMLLLRCFIKILKSILGIGLCLKMLLLLVMTMLCCLLSYVTMMCLLCFCAQKNLLLS